MISQVTRQLVEKHCSKATGNRGGPFKEALPDAPRVEKTLPTLVMMADSACSLSVTRIPVLMSIFLVPFTFHQKRETGHLGEVRGGEFRAPDCHRQLSPMQPHTLTLARSCTYTPPPPLLTHMPTHTSGHIFWGAYRPPLPSLDLPSPSPGGREDHSNHIFFSYRRKPELSGGWVAIGCGL